MGAKVPAPSDFPTVFADLGGNVTHAADHYKVTRGQIRTWRADCGNELELAGVSVNATGGVSKRYKVAQPAVVVAARTDGWRAPRIPRRPKSNKAETFALFSDYQFPFHDPDLHTKSLSFLEDFQPDNILYPGDSYDFPDVSKFADKEEWAATVNQCLTSGYHVFRDHAAVAPKSRKRKIKGNHEQRLESYIKANAGSLWGVRPAATEPGNEWHSLSNLGRLDELGIEMDETRYPDGEIVLSDKLVVIHGTAPKKGSGNTVRAALDNVDHSIVQADCHRQAIVFKTRWSPKGQELTRLGMELGCMCLRWGGLGYAGRRPDWQNGFGVVTIWPDGWFSAELATYVKGSLIFRGKRY